MADLPPHIKQTADVRERLTQATEALNVALREAEEAIARLGYGVQAYVDFAAPEDEGETRRLLGFKRIGDQWRLVVTVGDEERPLLNCSRSQRLFAVEHLSKLVRQMEREAHEEAVLVDVQLGKLKEFIAAVVERKGS